jgi:intein/homing endonuclease
MARTKKTQKEESTVTVNDVAKKFLKDNEEFHYNYEEDIFYKVSSGSLEMDLNLDGGLNSGLHRFCGPSEVGKAQPVSEPVLTPNGWVKMGDLKVGDKVIGSDGNPCEVLGVFPQGKKEIYNVKFRMGGSVRCCDEHLWETSSFNERMFERGETRSVKPLKYIRETLKYGSNYNHSIRMVAPVNFEAKTFKIDPYLLGVLIGDGGITESVSITSSDKEIWEEVEEILKRDYPEASLSFRCDITNSIVFKNIKENPLKCDLRYLGLMGKKSHEKFIPEEYKFGSIKQRERLLQGLINTDGYVPKRKKGGVIYYTTSEALAEDVAELVRSLGGTANINKKKTSYLSMKSGKRVICKDCYCIGIRTPDDVTICTLKRKAENLTKNELRLVNRIVEVEKEDEEEECVCIKVSALDSLYVTKDYVLTHNTSSALSFMKNFLDEPEKRRGLYIKAEGRLSPQMRERSGVKFVFDTEEWIDGTCFVFESNIYETVVEFMRMLVKDKESGIKYFFLLDSVDGLISKQDLGKSFEDSNKVAGGAVIAANFMKRASIPLAKRGHIAIFISQVRANIQLDPYTKEPIRQTTATGGNALLHFANYILDFEQRFNSDFILENQKEKYHKDKNKYIGHYAKCRVKKSPNERSNSLIRYPIKYGRKGGKSVWVELEVIDLMKMWGFLERRGAWYYFEDGFKAEIAEKVNFEFPEKLQGESAVFKMLEENEEVTRIIYQYFKEIILANDDI